MKRLFAPENEGGSPRGRCAGFLLIENVRQVYGHLVAIDDVSLAVAPGEILCLLGASGCGKTTLLRLAAGVEAPTSGRISLDGREVAGPSVFVAPEERGVGLVFQDYALFPHMSIIDNVMFGLRHMRKAQARELALRALDRVALSRYADDFPHMLSGGEQQRVALARALAPRPSVILMDEPFSNLDQRLRETIRDETIALLREEGISAVVVTHDPEEAMHIADRIALMRAGRIVQTGTAEDLYFRPETLFAARFFCDFNEIEALSVAGEIPTALGTFPSPADSPDEPCLVCIRPQALQIDAEGQGHPAEVVSRRFLGRVDRIRLRVPGLPRDLYARLRDARAFRPGQKVGLRIDPRDVLTFPNDNAKR
ncbi:MAG: ABC transporter ATP-binding protein [Beijerinckiaceae bacterium]|nr:ABC transporter ATP-binding protein [Beijerinckiaceae bacterium]